MNKGRFKVIDLNKSYYTKSDSYLNGHAKHCGWKATLAYDSLCRHADRSGESFPSIKLMAEEHGVSYNTIRRGVKTLQDWHIVKKEQKKSKKGKYLHNTYFLLHKDHWKKPVAPSRATDKVEPNHSPVRKSPSPSPGNHRRPDEGYKGIPILRKTHKKEEKALSPKKSYSSIKSINEEDLIRLTKQYGVPLAFVKSKYDDMINWHESTGKVKRNWLATLRNWVKTDAMKLRKEQGVNSKIAFINPS